MFGVSKRRGKNTLFLDIPTPAGKIFFSFWLLSFSCWLAGTIASKP
jgi:hypothetical protein